jgi:hypothetical protein
MTFRITLFNDTDSIEINEMDGLRDAVIKLDRDDNFHSLVQFFEGAFIFYGEGNYVNGGFHFIKQTEIDFGPDADLRALIEIAPDDETFSTLHDGQFKLSDLEEMPDNKIKVPIIRDDFWAKFISRWDTPVNIQSTTDLDNQICNASEAISLQLSSQIINKTTRYEGSEDIGGYDFAGGEMGEAGGDPGTVDEVIVLWTQGTTILEISEIKDSYEILTAFQETEPIIEIISVLEESGEATLTWKFRFQFNFELIYNPASSASTTIYFVRSDTELYYRINDGALQLLQLTGDEDIVPTQTLVGGIPELVNASLNIETQGSEVLNISVGDSIYFYAKHTITFRYTKGDESFDESTWVSRSVEGSILEFSGSGEDPFVNIAFKSIFRETDAAGFLLHDVGGAIIDRITGTEEKFYSEFLGSEQTLYKQYDEDGCQWTNALTRGLQLRQYTLAEKPFSISFKKWWDGANPILNLGLGYEDINGEQVIRVEEKSHFYNQSSGTSYDFSFVRDIVRKYDNDRIFNKVEIGYARWESEDISGIDDPQSKRIYASRFKKIGQAITLLSEFIGASLAIETTRRTTREKSADYKYDNEIFIISINPTEIEESPATSPDVITFAPELDENFSSVTGLLNSETRYNIRHSVAHMFLRWKSYLQGCLQSYIGSVFKFTSGQGNFDMASTMDLDCDVAYNEGAELVEDQDFVVDTEIFHLCNLYEFTAPLDYEDFESIVANRKIPVGLSQSGTDHMPMFIKTLSYKVAHGEVTIQAWPTEFFDIQVQDDAVATQECFAMPGACEDGITDDNGIQIVDENGICITA